MATLTLGKWKLKYRINGALFRRRYHTQEQQVQAAAILVANQITVVMTGPAASKDAQHG